MNDLTILKTEDIAPIHAHPGDSLTVTYTDANGVTTQVASEKFEDAQVIDRIVIVRIKGELALRAGLKDGYGALLGQRAE